MRKQIIDLTLSTWKQLMEIRTVKGYKDWDEVIRSMFTDIEVLKRNNEILKTKLSAIQDKPTEASEIIPAGKGVCKNLGEDGKCKIEDDLECGYSDKKDCPEFEQA